VYADIILVIGVSLSSVVYVDGIYLSITCWFDFFVTLVHVVKVNHILIALITICCCPYVKIFCDGGSSSCVCLNILLIFFIKMVKIGYVI
jgi:hypothetical protein